MRRRGFDRAVVPLQVHPDYVVPFLFGHVEDHAVAQDPGDVHQDIELAEFLDRLVDEAFAAFDAGDIHVIGNRVAARGFDFLDHVVGGRLRFLLPRDRDAKIVDYHCASLRGECPRDAAADTAATAGDGGYFSVELAHRSILPCGVMPESKRAQRFGSCDSALIPQIPACGTAAASFPWDFARRAYWYACSLYGLEKTNSVTTPEVVMRPTLPLGSVNHSDPSGPAVINVAIDFAGIGNAVIWPLGVMR